MQGHSRPCERHGKPHGTYRHGRTGRARGTADRSETTLRRTDACGKMPARGFPVFLRLRHLDGSGSCQFLNPHYWYTTQRRLSPLSHGGRYPQPSHVGRSYLLYGTEYTLVARGVVAQAFSGQAQHIARKPRTGSAKSPGGTSHTAFCRTASAHRLGVSVRLRNIFSGMHDLCLSLYVSWMHAPALCPVPCLHGPLLYVVVRAGRHTGTLFPAQKITATPAHTTVISIRLPAHNSCLSLPFRAHRVRTSRAYAPGVTSLGR